MRAAENLDDRVGSRAVTEVDREHGLQRLQAGHGVVATVPGRIVAT